MKSVGRDRRSNVRGELSCIVKYKTISPNEFELIRNNRSSSSRINFKKITSSINHSNEIDSGYILNDEVIHFLIQMDEKMDRILSLLKDEKYTGQFQEGIGKNISASSINIVIDTPAKKGQILQMFIILSKIPFVGIDVYGEIIRVSPMDKPDKKMWQIVTKFIELDEISQEKIIAYIFQRQRMAIRERKRAIS